MNEPINLDYKIISDLFYKLNFEESMKRLFEKMNNQVENDWFIPIFFVHNEIIIEIPAKPLLLEYKDEHKIHNE